MYAGDSAVITCLAYDGRTRPADVCVLFHVQEHRCAGGAKLYAWTRQDLKKSSLKFSATLHRNFERSVSSIHKTCVHVFVYSGSRKYFSYRAKCIAVQTSTVCTPKNEKFWYVFLELSLHVHESNFASGAFLNVPPN